MQRLRAASTEADMYRALRSIRLESGVVQYEALDDTVLGLAAPTSGELSDFAVRSARLRPELWSRRVRRQYRWALFRLPSDMDYL